MKKTMCSRILPVFFCALFIATSAWAQPFACETLVEGLNEEYMVNGLDRSFYLDLPENVDEGGPWPVVFSWHGFGDTAPNFRRLISGLVDNAVMPFIGITVEDSQMIFDWDILDAVNPENREALLFDALLDEIDVCWSVDWDHVHSMGYSFGNTVSDMLGVVRGDVIASIAGWSSVYGSNPKNPIPFIFTNWPELTTTNRYVELRAHGGILDWYFIPFGKYGRTDIAYLNENGHDAIDCTHNFFHNMGAVFMGPDKFIQFFSDHPWGTFDSPYEYGMPADFPESCVHSPKH